MRYREDQPIPPGYHLEERTRTGLVIAGSITLGVPYILGVSIAADNDFENGSGWLLVPALGPWITMIVNDEDCAEYELEDGSFSRTSCGINESAADVLLVLDGLVQGAGATMLLVGALSTKKVLVRDDVAHVRVMPRRIGTGYGVGVFGEF